MTASLIVFSGLPGTGKSTLARALADHKGAVYVRIDSIEQGLKDGGIREVGGAGYSAGYRIAKDNLDLGQCVVADSVNPLAITRDAWRDVGNTANVPVIDIEVVCSDSAQHQAQVEQRTVAVPGLKLPTWTEVQQREYEPWTDEVVRIDTANRSEAEALDALLSALGE